MYSKHSAAVAAPPLRRRRPALSCFQCRRRKIKCDQKTPCNQCQRSKGAVCTYGSQTISSSATVNLHHEYSQVASQSIHHFQPAGTLNLEFHIPTPETSVTNLSTTHSPHAHGSSTWPDPSTEAENRGEQCKSNITCLGEKNQKVGIEHPYTLYSPDVERHVTGKEAMPDVQQSLRKFPMKMKLFGEGHWMYQMLQLNQLVGLLFKHMRTAGTSEPTDLVVLLMKCKNLGKIIKSENVLDMVDLSNFRDSVPSRNVCDELVDHYLRVFESIHRILHVPSFREDYEDYWTNPHSASNVFIMKLLLVLAIGTSLCPKSESTRSLRAAAHQWVHIAQHWVSAPLQKSRMNLGGIQVQCLILLAREVVGVGSDLMWISAGCVLRTAMQLGYHRDPKNFPDMSVLHAEMRRRLWATILELVIKTSYDTAMPPLISFHDFDTMPPSNIDDSELSKATKTLPQSKPLTTFTQTSLQILLNNSINTRYEILRATTSFRFEAPYEEILRLSLLITNACRDSTKMAQSYAASKHPSPPTTVQLNHLDILTRRAVFTLHRGYSVKAQTDPRYYFSRKVSFDTAIACLSLTTSDDYSRLIRKGAGIWRETTFLSCMTVSLELTTQLEEEAINPPSAMQLMRARTAREPFMQWIRDAITLTLDRIKEGDVNVKGHLFNSMVLAQIEAMERGDDRETAIEAAAKESLNESYSALKEMCAATPSSDLDTHSVRDVASWQGVYDGDYGDINIDFFQDGGLDFETPDMGLFANWDPQ